MNGLPVAFAFMRHEDNNSLEFVYKNVTKILDASLVRMVMVDKDLSNIDFINQFYPNAQLYLCTFHVIKYLKSRLTAYKLTAAEKGIMRSLITSLIYAESEVEYDGYHEQIQKFGDKSFVEYWDKNWDNCKRMWMHLYRRDGIPTFGTNTNNHIESFNNTLKRSMKHTEHLSTTLQNLLSVVGDFIRKENGKILLELKVPVCDSSVQSALLVVLATFMGSKALDIGMD